MTPKELLKTWLGTDLPSAQTLLRSPSYKIPLNWGNQPAVLTFALPVTEVIYGLQVAYGNDVVAIGLSNTAECTDFSSLVSGRDSIPEELQLAVLEAELQNTLLALSPATETTPKIEKLLKPDDPVLKTGLAFHLVTAEKEALIASGVICLSTTMINAWTNLDFLNPDDESIISQPTCQAICTAVQFDLPEAPEPGDHVILPELKDQKTENLPVILTLPNGLNILAQHVDANHLALKDIVVPKNETPANAALVEGMVTVHYHDLLQLIDGQTPVTLPMEQNLGIWHHGRPVATGFLSQLANTPSFEVESVIEDQR